MGSSPTTTIFLYVAQAVECVLEVAFGHKVCWFGSQYRHISYVAQAFECMLGVPSGTIYVGSDPNISIFLYVAQAVEHVLAFAFGTKSCRFESHYLHISLCSLDT